MKDEELKNVQNQNEEILTEKTVERQAEKLLNSEAEMVEGGKIVDQDDLSSLCSFVSCQSNT